MGAWVYPHCTVDRDEKLVALALAEYRVDFFDQSDPPPEVPFTPTHVLYATYMQWLSDNVPAADVLGERQFGRALRKAIGVDETVRQFRRYEGKRTWGYVGLQGPGSIVVVTKRGRPNVNRLKAAEAAAPSPEVRRAEADPE